MSTSCGNPETEQDALMTRRTKFDKTKTSCFFPLISTRFRKTLGPTINNKRGNKGANARGGRIKGLMQAPGSLVIGHSGGLGSTVLLDLVAKSYFYRSSTSSGQLPEDSLSLGSEHPRNRARGEGDSGDVWKGTPAVCYVEVASVIPGAKERTEEVRAAVKAYSDPTTGFEIDFIPLRLEDAFDEGWWKTVGGTDLKQGARDLGIDINDEALPTLRQGSNIPTTPLQSLHTYLSSLPTPTAIHSAISSLIRVLLLFTAASRDASHLLLGTSLTSLSMNMISGIAQGAGFAMVSEGLEEAWIGKNDQNISIVRPLRDIGIKESAFWAWWSNLPVPGRDRYPSSVSSVPLGSETAASRVAVKQNQKLTSIDVLTQDFIMGLEKDFPSTVSTIARTLAKVTTKEKGVSGGCVVCQKPAQPDVQAWKASISIRSYHDEAFVKSKHPLPPHFTSPPDAGVSAASSPTNGLAPRLCYSCHTTFTSRSSRGIASANEVVVPLPVWVKASLPSSSEDTTVPESKDLQTGSNEDVAQAEVWETKKLSRGSIKDKIGAFLLDDAGDE
ncbi:hypothetical protein D9611_001518 [Ephemerocybe angulata]|uniref:Cytoplasmic tRNA 2-thiolation protein 2 n=1 Tax=Ephemerocybe angulata TaxID=980116 RepID=A0A8H5CHN1_9AGAR|nr:hypothetical protein D9611_001518 [Tulosesus angulatus]